MSKCPYREWSVHDRGVEYRCVGGVKNGFLCEDEWSEHYECDWVRGLDKVTGQPKEKVAVAANEAIREVIIDAHMAGQIINDPGYDCGQAVADYGKAREYYDDLFASEKD